MAPPPRNIQGFRKESVITAFELIKENYTDEVVDKCDKMEKLQSKIDKYKSKMDKLIEIYTDGNVDKLKFIMKEEEYKHVIQESEDEIGFLSRGKNSAKERLEAKLEHIKQTLEKLVDFDVERLDEDIIKHLVDKVVVRDDYEFEWLINLSDIKEKNLFCFNLNEKYEVKRKKTIEIRDTKYIKTYSSTITVDMAQEYRKKYGRHIKSSRWHDIHYTVYVR